MIENQGGFGANLEQTNKNSPPSYLEGLLTCSGRESNIYDYQSVILLTSGFTSGLTNSIPKFEL